jgi:proteic killer suppression protein
VIKSFRHKGIKQLFEKGKSAKVNAQQKDKCLRLLDALDAALEPDEMNLPGWNFHPLKGNPKRYSVSVTGNWRITFGWKGEDAIHIDLEDYH